MRPKGSIVTNRGVLDLLRATISEQLIIETIRRSGCDFDLGTEDLVELKSHGVSEAILNAMLQRQDPAATESS
jgi:hypothetical protein